MLQHVMCRSPWTLPLLAVASLTVGGCASVEGLVADNRLGDACRLAHDDGGLFRDRDAEVALLREAVLSRIDVGLVAVDDVEVATVVGEALRDGRTLPLAWLTVGATADMTLHEQAVADADVDVDVMKRLDAALPPLLSPPPPLLPPGPLEMPPAPDPTPPRPSSSSSSSGGGLLGAFVELVTLPFRAAAAVGEALITIPFDLFGARAPFFDRGSSTSTTRPPADPRLPGEAVLPAEAWAAAKQRILDEHAAASAAVDAARVVRHQRLVALADRLRERCVVVDGAPCRRLVLLSRPSLTTRLSVALGSQAAPCGLDDDVAVTAALEGPAVSAFTPVTPLDDQAAPPDQRAAPGDVAVLDAATVRACFKDTVKNVDALETLACHIEIKPRWRRLVKTAMSLQVRLAAGALAGRGASVTVPSAAIVDVGIRQAVLKGDHVKVVVGSDDGFIGGAIGRFDGVLPLRLEGESLTATCR